LSYLIAVVAALAAAVVFGIASVADQRSTKRVRSRRALSPRIFLDLVKQPLWIASIGGTVFGFALQVVALKYGPLAVVEPILVCDLIFAALISAYLRKKYDPSLLSGVVVCAGGIIAFILIAKPQAGVTSVGAHVVLPLAIGLAAAIAGCLVVANRSTALKPLALALACGVCYGVSAFLVKIVVSNVHLGLVYLLTHWAIYALAVVGPLGFLLNENAFQQGTLISPVLAIITACDPIVSIALGALWLKEGLANTTGAIIGEILALIAMVIGIVIVSHRAQRLMPVSAPAPSPSSGAGQARK
jgi:drug/metabolite transporter (DMT)-like permease